MDTLFLTVTIGYILQGYVSPVGDFSSALILDQRLTCCVRGKDVAKVLSTYSSPCSSHRVIISQNYKEHRPGVMQKWLFFFPIDRFIIFEM